MTGKDPRPGTDRLCFHCGRCRAIQSQHGYCSPQCRFWSMVTVTDYCWEWNGSKNTSKKGYGRITVLGVRWLAHRYAYTLLVGDIPDGLELDHVVCRNTMCVNPAHLEPVTSIEHDRRSDHGAYNRIKTHCSHGHGYTSDNTRTDKNGRRHCRQCERERRRA